jgi:uncharacterized protein YbjT (DUF2867 family)
MDEKAMNCDEQALMIPCCRPILPMQTNRDLRFERKSMKTNHTTLVVGGTGKTGRRVVERLQLLGFPCRVGSRSAQPGFDWEDRKTWSPALEAVAQAYVTYYPDLCVPGALDKVRSFFELAVNAGVKKLVFLSGRGEAKAEQAEQALKKSGANWTILRCSFFCQNFSETFFLDPILAGEVALPVAPVGEPFVDVEDIADVAVTALTQPGHSGKLYELTGPRALTFAGAIEEIARATGRHIQFVAITPEEYRTAMLQAQVPTEVIDLVLYLFGTVLDGRNTPVADGVQRALDRAPRDFADYVQRTAATGVWGKVR